MLREEREKHDQICKELAEKVKDCVLVISICLVYIRYPNGVNNARHYRMLKQS